jgi:site-specific DNA-methyltransferase (adenine-specific)
VIEWTLHHGDCLDVLPTLDPVDAVVTDPPYGLEFMGKAWDHGVPGVPYWAAVRDALKPGGHLLAFGGTRTHHRLMVGIEDAGFEIRDVIMWVYGSGFPKSLNVAKAVEATELQGGSSPKDLADAVDATSQGVKSAPGRTGLKWDRNDGTRQGVKRHESGNWTPTTDRAKQWDGWGTALKPAWEPIILGRRPLEGTVAQNVLAHGVGGINIDGCRVGTEPRENPPASDGYQRDQNKWNQHATPTQAIGRWPANLIHDGSDEVTRLMPDDAARFFYCAKAAQSDRNEGIATGRNTHPTVKPLALMRYLVRLVTPPGGVVCDPFMGSGSTGKAADLEGCGFVGIDRDAEACRIAAQRRRAQRGLF